MSEITIPLPVTVEPHRNGWFRVVSARDEFVADAPDELTAKQIALALNLHDGLVKALTSIRDMTDADDEKSYRADDREGCLDTCHAVAKEMVAKEKLSQAT